jgi:archaellum biogenesis ATPase FlaH
LTTAAPGDALAGAVPGGGLVLIWARNDAGDSQVVAQLFTADCSS